MERRYALATTLATTLALALCLPAAAPAAATSHSASTEAWRQDYRDAIDTHLLAQTDADDPRTRLMAAWRQEAATRTGHLATVMRQALAEGGDDPLLAWIEAAEVLRIEGVARPEGGRERLARLDPDNAAVQLLLAEAAARSGDSVAEEAHFLAVMDTGRYDSYFLAIGRHLRDAVVGATLPPMSAEVAAELGSELEGEPTGRPTYDAGLHREIETMAIAIAVAMPALQYPLRRCFPEQQPVQDAGLRTVCRHLSRQMAADRTNALVQRLGLTMLLRLAPGDTEAPAWREALRQHAWTWQNGTGLVARHATDPDSSARYLDAFYAQGELAAMRELLRIEGIPLTPPADWLPTEQRLADLISHGIYQTN